MPTISPGARPSPTRFSATLANPKMAGAGVKAGANRVSMASGRSFAYTPPVPRTPNPPLPSGAMPKPPAPFGKRLAYKTEPPPSLTIATRLVPQEHAPSEIVKPDGADWRSEEHTSELQSPCNLVCRLLLEKKTKPTGHAIGGAGHMTVARADHRRYPAHAKPHACAVAAQSAM